MVYGAAFCLQSMKKSLDQDEFQDSKTLTENERNQMFSRINSEPNIGWFATVLSPIVISNSMLKRFYFNAIILCFIFNFVGPNTI